MDFKIYIILYLSEGQTSKDDTNHDKLLLNAQYVTIFQGTGYIPK